MYASSSDSVDAVDLTTVLEPGSPSTVLVTSVRWAAHTGDSPAGWVAGPLPIVQAVNSATDARARADATDEPARRSLVAPQQADALYGTGPTRRRHRILDRDLDAGVKLVAIETLVGPAPATGSELPGLLAIHLGVGTGTKTDDADFRSATGQSIGSHDTYGTTIWQSVQSLLPPELLLTRERVRASQYERMPAADWTEQEVLARAYTLATSAWRLPLTDAARRSKEHTLTIHRADWSAIVLRDGAAYLSHQTSEESFAEALRVLAHSVYVDAMLLALMQRRLVDESGERAVTASLTDPRELVDLERRHFDFKRNYWRTSLTVNRTSPTDKILSELQRQLLTPDDVADVEDRVADGARLAHSLHAERQDEAQQRVAKVARNASIVIGALGLAFTAAPVVASPSWTLFAAAGTIGLVAMLLAFLILLAAGRISRPPSPPPD